MRSLPSEGLVSATVVGVELSIIIPTFNERDNIVELVARLCRCLPNRSWEAIFVDDDSTDGTADVVRDLGKVDRRVRCLQRIGRRGLASACVEGMLASSAPYLAVIDADLQHDERLLERMLQILQTGEYDIVIGSRYTDLGTVGDWSPSRVRLSQLSASLGRTMLGVTLTDPTSGFFMMRREVLDGCVRRLSAIGFKILLDIFASSPRPLRFKELGYDFRTRQAGASKMDSRAAWDYLMLLVDKYLGRAVPVRFVSFAFVGGFGVLVHMAILLLLLQAFHVPFTAGQAIATLAAITSNFVMNNALTYSDMRLRGLGMLRGWLSFTLICGIGALANVGIASLLYEQEHAWFISALAGVAIGSVWNYAVSAIYTWRPQRR